jgi:formylglycine-generating enzyme required for sulfatase activity
VTSIYIVRLYVVCLVKLTVVLDTAAQEPGAIAQSIQTVKTVTFPYVAADKITDRLSIRIVRLNGRSVETAAKANAVSIMTEAVYASIFEQQISMISIPGGIFMMGGPGKDEQPRSQVLVRPFYMGKYEVTSGEYWTFLTATGQEKSSASLGASDSYPVDKVDWFDAVRYCNWLSEKTGRQPVYTIRDAPRHSSRSPDDVVWDPDADGYRLPTEAEWEYACRAGTTTAYSFGDSISPAQARYGDSSNGGRYPVPVGSFAPNPWGLYDMHGNVSEWCWDHAPAFGGGYRCVVRGGHCRSYAEYLRSAFRNWNSPNSGSGFRVVYSAKEVILSAKKAAEEEELAGRRRTEERLKQGIYEVGETGPAGGLVFYDKGSVSGGWRFLEAAPASTEFEAKYYEAVRKCKALTVNGIGNWRLPTKKELNLLYANKSLGGFSGDFYWSSSGSLLPLPFLYSWVVRFSDGYDGFVRIRFVPARARAVRAF